MSASSYLRAIKALHTAIWLFFVTCILAIPVFGLAEMYHYALWLTGIVLIEVFVLVFNGWKCPLTGVAARYTDDRHDSFDIYLPEWLARHNKLIFGSIFVVGEVVVFLHWRGWIG
jgi:polyferredoxin